MWVCFYSIIMKTQKTPQAFPPSSVDVPSVAELWAAYCVNEHHVPRMLEMPKSSWDMHKRRSAPRIFAIGKRRYILVADLKRWLEEQAERTTEAE